MVIDYQSDAERKRIDYAIERWKDKCDVRKPKGMVLHFGGGNIDDFLDDLYSRLSLGKESVHVFSGESYSPSITEQIEHLSYTTSMDLIVVSKFLNYIVNKIGASYDGETSGVKKYTAYTKKGQVGIDISLKNQDKTNIDIVIRGYGDAVLFISNRIEKELKVFLEID